MQLFELRDFLWCELAVVNDDDTVFHGTDFTCKQ